LLVGLIRRPQIKEKKIRDIEGGDVLRLAGNLRFGREGLLSLLQNHKEGDRVYGENLIMDNKEFKKIEKALQRRKRKKSKISLILFFM